MCCTMFFWGGSETKNYHKVCLALCAFLALSCPAYNAHLALLPVLSRFMMFLLPCFACLAMLDLRLDFYCRFCVGCLALPLLQPWLVGVAPCCLARPYPATPHYTWRCPALPCVVWVGDSSGAYYFFWPDHGNGVKANSSPIRLVPPAPLTLGRDVGFPSQGA